MRYKNNKCSFTNSNWRKLSAFIYATTSAASFAVVVVAVLAVVATLCLPIQLQLLALCISLSRSYSFAHSSLCAVMPPCMGVCGLCIQTYICRYVGVCMFVHMLIYVNVCKFMYMCLYVSMLFCLFIYVHASDTANYILLWAFYYFRSWTLFTHPYLYVCACVHLCLCVCACLGCLCFTSFIQLFIQVFFSDTHTHS